MTDFWSNRQHRLVRAITFPQSLRGLHPAVGRKTPRRCIRTSEDRVSSSTKRSRYISGSPSEGLALPRLLFRRLPLHLRLWTINRYIFCLKSLSRSPLRRLITLTDINIASDNRKEVLGKRRNSNQQNQVFFAVDKKHVDCRTSLKNETFSAAKFTNCDTQNYPRDFTDFTWQ